MRSRSGLVLSAILVALAMPSGEAIAFEGRAVIHNLPSGGPPFVLDKPGHYILVRNITIATGHAIIIDSDCVELNLNGKSITHSGSAFGDNLIEIKDVRTDVTIYNGWLTGGHRGINHMGGNAPGGASPLGLRARIRDVEIRGAADRGISIHGADNVELISNQVHEIGGPYGIYVHGDDDTFTGRFVENTVEDVSGRGIYLHGFEGGNVIRNVVRRYDIGVAGSAAIELADTTLLNAGGNIIKENTISSGSGDGLIIGESQNNLVKDNVIYQNGRGLVVGASAGNMVRNNTIGHNTDGITVGGERNLIDGNHIEGNVGIGLQFTGVSFDNICRDNTVQGGPPGGVPPQIVLGVNEPNSLCR